MRLLVLFTILLILPAVAYAQAGVAEAVAHVYVYDIPEISVSLVDTEDGLICSWDIEDGDPEDSFSAEVLWSKDGELFASETIDCGPLRHCAAHEKPEAAPGEIWICSVMVEDSFGALAMGSAEFYRAPLGFFGGLLQSLLALLGLA